MRTGRIALLAVAIALFVVSRLPILSAFVFTYLAAWAAYNYLPLPKAPPLFRWVTGLAAAALVLFLIRERGPLIWETEQLDGLVDVLYDRHRIQATPTISPAVIADDRPQLLYVYAPASDAVALSFGGPEIAMASLGHGLFRVMYDPRKHSAPQPIVQIIADGTRHEREVLVEYSRPHPRWPCASNDKQNVAVVSEETDQIYVLDGQGVVPQTTNDGPTDCAWLDDGRLVITHRFNEALTIGDLELPVGLQQLRVAKHDGEIAVAIHRPPAVVRISTSTTPVVIERVALRHTPDWLAYGDDGIVVVASREARQITRLDRPDEPIALGRPAITMTTSPSHRRLFVAVTDYRPDGGAGPNHHIAEQIITVDLPSWRIIDRFETGDLGATPTGLQALDEDVLVIAFAGSDTIARVAVTGPNRGETTAWPSSGHAPYGVVESRDGFVTTSLVTGAIERRSHSGDVVLVHRLDDGRPADGVRRGERGFYEATRDGVSCATCHLHGGSDFSLHDIGHGEPRATLDLAGVARTAPYLRGASYPNLGALHEFAELLLGGYGREDPERAKLLEAYVARRPRNPTTVLDLDSAEKGVDAFVEAGCDACHTLGAFTNLAQVPSSALFPERGEDHVVLDVPSLIGIGESAPYLHDGRAATLRETLFEHNESGRHGRADRLSEEAQNALFAFLETL